MRCRMAPAAKPGSILLVCLTLAACGGEDQTDGGASVPAATTETSVSSAPAPKAAPKPRYSGPLADGCRELARGRLAMLARLGAPPGALDASAGGDSTRAQCLIRAKGVQLKATLDAAPQAARRYANFITESAQFSVGSPERRPRPVGGVGRGRGAGSANWIPAFSEIVSLRGNHVLTVNFVAAGVPVDTRRRAAIATSLFLYHRLGL
jgi:hypothetical protein